MKKKIIALLALVLAISTIASVSGCSFGIQPAITSNTSLTTETTTTDAVEFFDTKTSEESIRVVKFGGQEKAVAYLRSLEFDIGYKYDCYVNGDEEYRYDYGTDKLARIEVSNFGGNIIAKSEALKYAMDFLRPGIPYFVKYEFSETVETEYYYKIVFTISRDESLASVKDPEFETIMAFIPNVKGTAQFWFDPTYDWGE